MSSGACIALRCGRMLDDVSFTWFSLKAGRSRWLCTPCGVRVRFVDVWVPFSHEAWVLHRCGLQLVPTAPWDRSTSPWHVRMRVLATRHVSINTASKVNRTSKNVQKQRGEERKARGVFSLDREGLGFGPWRSYEGSLVRPRGSNRTSFRTPSRLTPPSILTRPASSRNVHERGRGFPPPRPGSSSSSSLLGSLPLSTPTLVRHSASLVPWIAEEGPSPALRSTSGLGVVRSCVTPCVSELHRPVPRAGARACQ